MTVRMMAALLLIDPGLTFMLTLKVDPSPRSCPRERSTLPETSSPQANEHSLLPWSSDDEHPESILRNHEESSAIVSIVRLGRGG
jgi:hypothetical protein